MLEKKNIQKLKHSLKIALNRKIKFIYCGGLSLRKNWGDEGNLGLS
ncbi:hypothetical protein NEOC65_001044 [Neochlamydia sp. AcF65]|nr:hypothetical protein [Neochlamydia sp. AcF65]